MDTLCYFNELEDEQLYVITGGCGFCVAGTIIGSAATGAGIGGSFYRRSDCEFQCAYYFP